MWFTSDYAGPAAAEAIQAIAAVNDGYTASYGEEEAMVRVTNQVRQIFEAPDAAVYLVTTGTAANALSLACLCPPWGTVYCHSAAHVQSDECGAPEFYTGGAKLTLIEGDDGKINPAALQRALEVEGRLDVHSVQPGALSLTNATESGTVYAPDELRMLTDLAAAHGIPVHLDGARFTNALVSVGCTPAELTWKAGVDIMSLGGTKNGLIGVEAVVMFDPARAREFELRRKRGGHLASRHRFLSAQMEVYLTDGLWLDLAGRANRAASELAQRLGDIPAVRLVYPTEANAVFAEWTRAGHRALQQAGARYSFWPKHRSLEGDDDEQLQARMVCNWATDLQDIRKFTDTLSEAVR